MVHFVLLLLCGQKDLQKKAFPWQVALGRKICRAKSHHLGKSWINTTGSLLSYHLCHDYLYLPLASNHPAHPLCKSSGD